MWWFGSLGAVTLVLGLVVALLTSITFPLLGGGLLLASVVVGKSWLFLLERARRRLVRDARRDAAALPDVAPPRLASFWP